ncbi:MAG TPA: AmmeMemoRadiSam system protein B [Vicinamibacteria bacterium]|nr:AmmeMemoRadiSam system protein B [Vicinamibacteria bacterium]
MAGTWYPGSPRGIVAEVEEYLAAAGRPQVDGRLVGLISPHAGLRYSGPVAAHGYSLLRGRSSLTAVLVGPSHRAAFPGVSVFAAGAFETPLGRVPIAEDLTAALLAAEPAIRDLPGPHGQEHSLEMQLPFLQHLVPSLRIVPLLMGSQARAEVEVLSRALARVLAGREALLIASTDLSHYQPAPVAHRLDALVSGDVERFDADGLLDRLESSPGHACGGGALAAVMKAARALGADRAAVLRYGDSGDVREGDKSQVVGYLSAALVAGSA